MSQRGGETGRDRENGARFWETASERVHMRERWLKLNVDQNIFLPRLKLTDTK